MFSNPTVGHWVSGAHKLPILTIVFNNSRYGAVRRATLSMFKDGVAGENDGRMLADLDPAPPYDEMAKAQGAHAERVEKPTDLPDALGARPRRGGQRAPAGAAQRHHAVLSMSISNQPTVFCHCRAAAKAARPGKPSFFAKRWMRGSSPRMTEI